MDDNSVMTCNQRRRDGDGVCGNPSVFRYTWPGHDEAGICHEHVGKLRGVAQAMGFHLQLIEIER